jgi:hypothetical protein
MRTGTLPSAVCVTLALILSIPACGRHEPLTAPPRLEAGAALRTAPPRLSADPIRAGYLYSYVSTFHLDSLAGAGFNRAIVKVIANPLDARSTGELRAWMERARQVPVEVMPAWALQSPARLAALSTGRRYTWGSGTLEPRVGCPLDRPFWRSAWLDRAAELRQQAPGARGLVLDLEIYTGTPHHYLDPCRCLACRYEFALATGAATTSAAAAPALRAFQEARLTELLTTLAFAFAAGHPGLELGVFDLDRDSFVHRAMARALARARVPVVNYTERTYSSGAAPASQARAALAALGVSAPVVGGLWLKQFQPSELAPTVDAMLERAEGYFVFTTFSLWVEPSKLVGPYALQGTQAEYWAALRSANR